MVEGYSPPFSGQAADQTGEGENGPGRGDGGDPSPRPGIRAIKGDGGERHFFVWPRAKMLATKFRMSVALDSL